MSEKDKLAQDGWKTRDGWKPMERGYKPSKAPQSAPPNPPPRKK